jgi:hypothetical protein
MGGLSRSVQARDIGFALASRGWPPTWAAPGWGHDSSRRAARPDGTGREPRWGIFGNRAIRGVDAHGPRQTTEAPKRATPRRRGMPKAETIPVIFQFYARRTPTWLQAGDADRGRLAFSARSRDPPTSPRQDQSSVLLLRRNDCPCEPVWRIPQSESRSGKPSSERRCRGFRFFGECGASSGRHSSGVSGTYGLRPLAAIYRVH